MERQNSVYVRMLEDVLKKKEHLLRDILERTREQEALLKQEELDQERFHEILEEKGRWIEALNEMDEGFDTLFAKVESEIPSHKDQYKENIQRMQKSIVIVSEYGMKIQALENQNSERLKAYLSAERKKIREYHMNSQTASRYYRNMTNTHIPEQSFYFNQKK